MGRLCKPITTVQWSDATGWSMTTQWLPMSWLEVAGNVAIMALAVVVWALA